MKPKQRFSQVFISSELRTQGLRLLEHLISKRLIFARTGSQRPRTLPMEERNRRARLLLDRHVHPRRLEE